MATRTQAEPQAGAQGEPQVQDKRIPKTRIRAGTLRAALKDVTGVVEGRNTTPVLANVVLEVIDQRLTLTATDLDIWAVRDCATDDRSGPDCKAWLDTIRMFSVCLPAKPLEAVLAEFDADAMVTIEAPAEIDARWAGQVTVRAGKARFRLHALPVADFPLLGAMEIDAGFEMRCSALADAMAGVDHAISTDETRYYLNGIYLHPDNLDLRLATTDGSRLALWSIDGPDGAASFPSVIVSRKTVAVLEKLLAGAIKAADEKAEPPRVLVEANAAGSRLRFAMPAEDGGEVEIVAKTIDGTFPDYRRVIPDAPEHRATIGRSALAAAVKRMAVLADGKSRAMKIHFAPGQMTLSVRTPELGDGSEELDCAYDGPEIEMGFDSRYLRELLGAIASDTVALQFNPDALGAVRAAGWVPDAGGGAGSETGPLLQVIMPVRV
ncbi:DNA polymerase III subunit beta [Novosphingobium mangrovi (ex Huang et al. 2023)]|uniref:Beta sliding clamp n=1 Tax=Novosphingobium mangrovi (ex Huang et al. 2023) TaxID=2976432 RepID=A0ABT2I132_9SPHN|nr:DNA polymerase III subunit beta [Novosphingobium mangrovi (ex Huang et al. 2023)]MCT2398508.1 DNA polymerase III subunit beta [Novosphingobium mangrovi (ex Huang et al. 2023)]